MQTDEEVSQEIQERLDVEHKHARSSRKKWWLLLILLALLGGWATQKKVRNGTDKVHYLTAPIEKKSLKIIVSATGNLEPTNSVDVGIEVSGTISELYADYNQEVKKGQMLARIDTTKLESLVKNAKAALLVAKANLKEKSIARSDAKKELERGETMYKSTGGNYPSQKDLDALSNVYSRAQASYDAAVAGVTQSDAQLNSYEDDLKKALVRSPINGVVLDRKVEVGQTVVASMQIPVLFTLAEDLSKMEVVLGVDEADIGKVKTGQKVDFTVDAYSDRHFQGIITQVRFNSVIVSGVVTYETVVEVNNRELLLRPGMTASAEIITEITEESMVVPNAALRFVPSQEPQTGKEKKVWVNENGTLKAYVVETGESDSIFTIIRSSELQPQMQVVVGIQKAN